MRWGRIVVPHERAAGVAWHQIAPNGLTVCGMDLEARFGERNDTVLVDYPFPRPVVYHDGIGPPAYDRVGHTCRRCHETITETTDRQHPVDKRPQESYSSPFADGSAGIPSNATNDLVEVARRLTERGFDVRWKTNSPDNTPQIVASYPITVAVVRSPTVTVTMLGIGRVGANLATVVETTAREVAADHASSSAVDAATVTS